MKLTYKSVERSTPTPPATPARTPKLWSKQTVFPFGKHRGYTVFEIIVEDIHYITWALENIAGFVLDKEARAMYEAFKD